MKPARVLSLTLILTLLPSQRHFTQSEKMWCKTNVKHQELYAQGQWDLYHLFLIFSILFDRGLPKSTALILIQVPLFPEMVWMKPGIMDSFPRHAELWEAFHAAANPFIIYFFLFLFAVISFLCPGLTLAVPHQGVTEGLLYPLQVELVNVTLGANVSWKVQCK